ncbi:MAG: hypothetical protein PUB18_01170 [bacterium]|nr:hypothetical protein [bacterium]
MKGGRAKITGHLISILFIVFILVIGTVYVYIPNKEELLSSFSFLKRGNDLSIQDLSSGIHLAEAFPITDEEGLTTDAYQFKVINRSNHNLSYQIFFRNQKDKIKAHGLEVLSARYLRYAISEEGKESIVQNLLEDELVYEGVILANSERVFDFRIWLDEDCGDDAMGKSYIGKMEIVEKKSLR